MWLRAAFVWGNLLPYANSSKHPVPELVSSHKAGNHSSVISDDMPTGRLGPRDSCKFPWPSQRDWKEHKVEDASWIQGNLREFKVGRKAYQKETGVLENFPMYIARKYAPGSPPSNFQCDGLSACQIDTCHNLRDDLTPDEVRCVLLLFEAYSAINTQHRIITEGTQESFALLQGDLEYLAMEFTLSDEMQAKAVKRRETQELVINIITSLMIVATAAAGGLALWAEPIVGAASSMRGAIGVSRAAAAGTRSGRIGTTMSNAMRFPAKDGNGMVRFVSGMNSLAEAASGAYIGMASGYKEYLKLDLKTDEEQFDKLLQLMRHDITMLSEGAFTAVVAEMWQIATGEKTSAQFTIVDLYKSGFHLGTPAEFMRLEVADLTKMYWTAAVLDVFWKIEGAYISESLALEGSNCTMDTRGPQETKVCLEERPNHVYHLYAISNWDDGKLHGIAGLHHLEGNGFRGLTKESVVRSSLFKDEVWRAQLRQPGDPEDMSAIFLQPLLPEDFEDPHFQIPQGSQELMARDTSFGSANSSFVDTIKVLNHYGPIPGSIHLPICRGWGGKTISDINSNDHMNAACHCHPVNPKLASSWSSPNNWTLAYTDRFLSETGLYKSKSFAKLCLKEMHCKKQGTWKERLNLTGDDEPIKEMEHAWNACEHHGHGHHPVDITTSATPTKSSATRVTSSSVPAQHTSNVQPVTPPSAGNPGHRPDFKPATPMLENASARLTREQMEGWYRKVKRCEGKKDDTLRTWLDHDVPCKYFRGNPFYYDDDDNMVPVKDDYDIGDVEDESEDKSGNEPPQSRPTEVWCFRADHGCWRNCVGRGIIRIHFKDKLRDDPMTIECGTGTSYSHCNPNGDCI